MLVNITLVLEHSLLIRPHKHTFRKRLFSSILNSSLRINKVTVLLVFNLPPWMSLGSALRPVSAYHPGQFIPSVIDINRISIVVIDVIHLF